MNKYIWLFLFLGVVLMTGCTASEAVMTADEGKYDTQEQDGVSEVAQSDTDGNQQTERNTVVESGDLDAIIYVYVCGHVNSPGVYQLSGNARVYDALQLAGGVTEDGNPEALNQAECMTDGQTLYVPGIDEDVEEQTQQSAEDGLININQADRETLMTLPGIGESKADMIIQYREEHGAFQSVEELMDIPGIKEGVFNKMKGKIICR